MVVKSLLTYLLALLLCAVSCSSSPNDDPEIFPLSTELAVELELGLILLDHLKDFRSSFVPFLGQIDSLYSVALAYERVFYTRTVLQYFITARPSNEDSFDDFGGFVLYAFQRYSCIPWLKTVKPSFFAFPTASRKSFQILSSKLSFKLQVLKRIAEDRPLFKELKFFRTHARFSVDAFVIQRVKDLILAKLKKDFDPSFEGDFEDYRRLFRCSKCKFDLFEAKRAYCNLENIQFRRLVSGG
jgi:hypothetical protein